MVRNRSLLFDANGLWQEWEQNESIRNDLRNGKNLTKSIEGRDSTIFQCNSHVELLKPCLVRLLCANLKLPDISTLRDEVEELYKQCQREVTNEIIDDDSWELRKMLRLVKRKANREDVSLETFMNVTNFPLIITSFSIVDPRKH